MRKAAPDGSYFISLVLNGLEILMTEVQLPLKSRIDAIINSNPHLIKRKSKNLVE